MSVCHLDERRGTIGARRASKQRLAMAAATAAMSVGGAWLATRPAPARGATYVWQYGANSAFGTPPDANYSDPSNWGNQSNGGASDGVPGVSDTALINDTTTAFINPGDSLATGIVYVGYGVNGASNGFLNQSGGAFNVSTNLFLGYGAIAGEPSEYDISGGTLNSTGSFIQLLGSASVTDSAVMRIGQTATVNALGTDNGAGGGASMTVGDKGGNGHLYLSDSATLNTKYLLYVGVGSASSVYSVGVMDMTGGTLNMGSGIRVGAFGAKGTLNMTGGTLTQSNASSPSYLEYQTGSGTWNISGSSVVNMADELRVGGSDSTGTQFIGTGYLNVTGGNVTLGALTLGRGNYLNNTQSGFMTLTAGSVTSNGDVILGFAGMGTGQLNMSGGTLNVGTTVTKYLTVGEYDTTSSLLNLSGGALNLNAGSSIKMANQGNTGGNVINQTGGNVTFYSDNATTVGGTGNLDLQLGSGTGVKDTYNLYGGTLTVPSIVATNTNGARTFNFSGGLLRAAGPSTAFMAAGVASAVNVQLGGAVIDTNGFAIKIGQALQHDPTNGAPAVDGGLSVSSTVAGGSLTLTGTDTYTGATTIGANTTLQLGDGTTGNDGTIASTSGVTNNGTLVFNRFGSASSAYAITGTGSLTKLGAGTQALTGNDGYTGATTVTAGTLTLSGTGSINGTAGVSVGAPGKFLQLSSVASTPTIALAGTLDGVGTVGSVTVSAGGIVNNGNGTTGILNLNSLTYLGTSTDNLNLASNASAGLDVLNALTVSGSGPVTLNLLLNGGRFAPATYELIQYGSTTTINSGNVNTLFKLGTGLTATQSGSFSLATVGNNKFLDLNVTGSSASGLDRWTGSVNNNWDTTASDTNFTDVTYGGSIPFTQGDNVTFDNTSTVTAVNLATNVAPASATFNTSGVSYTLASTGNFGVTGAGALVINGDGSGSASLTIGTSNSYTGGTAINGGTLNLANAAALGTGPLTLNAGAGLANATGAMLQLSTNNAQNWNGNFSFSGSPLNMGTGAVALNTTPTITLNGSSTLQEGGVVANGSGGSYGLTLNGSSGSQLVMSGLSTFGGNITVNGGTYNASNGTSPVASGSFGNQSLTRTVTINSGGTVALTNGNVLGGVTAAVPKLTFVVNAGGVLETAAFNNGGGAGGNNNIFGPITLNGGTFTTGNGYSAAYPAANLLGTVTVTGTTTSQYGSVINTNATNVTGDGASLAAGGITFNVSSTGATVADLDVQIPLTNLNGAAGALIKTGAGTMQLDSANNNYTGSTTVNGGTLFVAANAKITGTGGVTVSGGTLNVTNFGELDVTSGKQLLVGTTAGVSGAMYQGGYATSNYVAIGEAASANTNNLSGYYSMGIGATLTGAGGANGVPELDVGGYYGGSGTFAELDMAGGTTVNLATTSPFFFVDRGNATAGSTGVANIGGTVQIYNGATVANAAGVGLCVGYANLGSQTSTITMSGAGKFLTPSLTVKLNDTSAGTVAGNITNQSVLNLNGGTFQTLGFGATANESNTALGNQAAVVNFNGGTLVAGNAANTTFMTGLGAVYVYGGGGTIDNNAQAITIGQPLASPTASGVSTTGGAIAVTNGGTGYLVPPKVAFSGGGGTGATGYATINPTTGAVTGIVVTNPGTGYTSAPTVTLTASGSGSGVVYATTAPIVTNTSGTVTFQGSGTTTLSGASTYTGGAALNAGTLNVTGSLASGVTVASGATLTGSGTGATGLIAGAVVAAGASTLSLPAATSAKSLTLGGGLTLGTSGTYGPTTYATLSYTLASGNNVEPLNVTGPLTFNGGGYVSLTNTNLGAVLGTYTLATYGSEVGGGQFSLSPTAANGSSLTVGRNTETLTDNGTSLVLTIAGAATPGVAYFDGQVSGKWNDVSNATLVNFSTNLAGTTDAGNIPAAGTDVILNATNAPSNVATNETLGASTTINSLNVNGNGTTSLAADGSTLTLLGLADTNTDTGGGYTGNTAGTGISIAAASNAFTVNTPIAISNTGVNQTWTNNSANLFTVGGAVNGSAGSGGTQTLTLVNTGAGGTTIGGAIGNGPNGGTLALVVANTGAGVTTLSGTDAYTGATTVAGGSLSVASTGSLTATSTITVGTVAGTPAALYQAGAITNLNTGAGGIAIANVPGAFGYYSLGSGAVLNVAGEIDPGGNLGGAGTFGRLDVASGATINLPSSSTPYFLPDRGATGEASVSNIAGTVQIIGGGTPANTALNGLAVGLQTSSGSLVSTVTVSGTGQFLTPSLTVKLNDTNFGATNGGNATNVSVLNLVNGGTLQTLGFGAAVNQAAANVGTGNLNAVVNFNGGKVVAGTAANSSFMTGLGAVYIYANGGTIDNNGKAITIGQAIASPTASGVSTANGAVAVTSGGTGYVVPPQVTFTGGGGTGATGYATISGGVVTGIVVTNPGTGYTSAPTVSLTASGSGTGAAYSSTAPLVTNTSGMMTFQGVGGKTTLTGASTYTGGTTIASGTVLANNATSSLGVGTTTINATGVLGGTAGLTGGPVVVNGGTLTAGSGATAADSISKLTTTGQTWLSGSFVDKVSNTSTGAGVGNDVLVMTGLTVSNPSGFTVSLLAATGSPAFTATNPTLTAASATPLAGSYVILAKDSEGTASPFNNATVVSALNLTVTGVATASASDSVKLAGYFDGSNYDLIAEDVAAATPEPASVLLLGAAVAPLALGRRSRRRVVAPTRIG